eukprot:CAMPEP_0171109392 /NCGR_PEP_ID=MMETSP0766_2-20121228/70751_1 /TAXON_ID=439317 /ORGANISM="Gambierdiscus australes, Strain CAWD 149" /LENGTH=346 /DNA_ID=CAMNT_0011571123 /DNA_START=77 /DNA_END=1117 /DNA_ORIENTATION=-
MGSAPSIQVHRDVQSLTDPDKLSVVSDPLTPYCDDMDLFYDGVIRSMKDPVLNPLDNYVIKTVEIKSISEEEWVFKIIHDGEKLQSFNLQETSEDRVAQWAHIWTSRERREIVEEFYSEDGESVTMTSHVRFHPDPFRIEAWLDMANGERRSGYVLQGVVRDIYINPIVQELTARKVRVQHSIESPTTNGVCAISSPLQDHIDSPCDCGGVFDTLVEVIKCTGSTWLAQVASKFSVSREVVEISEQEFQLSFTWPMKQGGQDTTVGTRSNFMCNRDKGEINGVASSLRGQLLFEYRFKIHEEPIRIEFYALIAGRRVGGRVEAGTLQALCEATVDLLGGKRADWIF